MGSVSEVVTVCTPTIVLLKTSAGESGLESVCSSGWSAESHMTPRIPGKVWRHFFMSRMWEPHINDVREQRLFCCQSYHVQDGCPYKELSGWDVRAEVENHCSVVILAGSLLPNILISNETIFLSFLKNQNLFIDLE